MIRVFLIVVFLGIFNLAGAQETKSKRAERKNARNIERLVNYNTLGAHIESRRFILEIENLIYPSGFVQPKNLLHNYISIDSTICVWQSGTNDIPTDLFSLVSKAQGSVDGWKLKRDDMRYRYFLEFRMFTDNGLYRVTVDFNQDRTFSGTINGIRDTFVFDGTFVKK